IIQYFPEWKAHQEGFMKSVRKKELFNITDFDTGIRFDFMTYKDSEYNWTAFQRRTVVEFFGIKTFISTKEDLIISKLKWYNITPSEKQMEDLRFLLLDEGLNQTYLTIWLNRLNINTHGLLG
ncbi:MAG: hypothetical protein AAF738_07025, partial [Bacteroidota bacterium]